MTIRARMRASSSSIRRSFHRGNAAPSAAAAGPAATRTGFTRASLDAIRATLSPVVTTHPSELPAHTIATTSRGPREAAVLIPLLNIADRPHVLMEVRSSAMRTHAGEVSFPGGKVDPTDRTLVEAALREAYEELTLSPDTVEILGMLDSPEYSLGNKARVWPIVGFLHADAGSPVPSGTALSSLAIDRLVRSPDEVSAILPLPLSALVDPTRRSLHFFRMDPRKPYHKIKVDDLVYHPESPAGDVPSSPLRHQQELEIWGLSGWFLNRLAWMLGWMKQPVVPDSEG